MIYTFHQILTKKRFPMYHIIPYFYKKRKKFFKNFVFVVNTTDFLTFILYTVYEVTINKYTIIKRSDDMYQFYVNGQEIQTDAEEKMLPFLRNMGLTSVKNGCSEGACGTCMVLVDGKATKACVLTTKRADQKHIVTVEGLSDREKEVYGYAFAKAGAVQCGFCTPGMVISAKGLLDQNLNPTREDVKAAIKNNICRCTGYQKIEDAILLAGEMLRENKEVPTDIPAFVVGEKAPRIDAVAKTLGTALYVDDLTFDNMLFGSAVRSAYPRARVLSIDTTEAEKVDGVVAILTGKDLKGHHKIGHLRKDYDVLISEGDITHFLGDAIVLVAAKTKESLEQAKSLVHIEYEPLEGVFSIADAMREDAPHVHEGGNLLAHEHLVRGNADEKIKNSKYVVTNRYVVPPTEHAFLEPETAIAIPENDGVHLYTSDQSIWQAKKECSEATGLPIDKVRVTAMMVGGGFGGKEDMSVQHHAAILALATNSPVKVSFTRQESILIHPKRHGMEIECTSACDEEGNLTALKATIYSDTGAYASLGGPVLQRACTHAAGPYHFSDIEIEGKAFYTNNPPAGAFRGFGVSQSCFAVECNLNQLAEKVGITPWEIRYKNAIRPGEYLPNGQLADETTALVETLEAVKPYYDANPKAGIACAIKNAGLGVGVPDTGRCRLVVSDGIVKVYSGAACIGQGLGTMLEQIVRDTLKMPSITIAYQTPDTDTSPDSGVTTASRQTLFTGEAGRLATEKLKSALATGKTLEQLEGEEFLGEYTGVTDPLGSDKEHPTSHIAYSYATHLVELDEEGKLARVVAAHDVGQAINPLNVEGQIDGGVVMSLGYALTEDYPLEQGKPLAKFGTLGLLRANQVPPVTSILVQHQPSNLACGGKGVGEISSIPTAPAVQLAYYMRDGEFRTSLPLENTPYSRKKK